MFDTTTRVHGADLDYLAEKIGAVATALISRRFFDTFMDSLNELSKRADPQFPRGGPGLREAIMKVNHEWIEAAAICAAELALVVATSEPYEPEPDEPEPPCAA